MIMRIVLLFLFVTVMGLNTVSGQRWSIEFRPQLNFPTQEIEGPEVKTGFGFDLITAYNMMPHLKAYTGWAWNQFETKADMAAMELDITQNSFLLGFELTIPKQGSPLGFFGNSGINYGAIRLENNALNIDDRSSYKIGWHAGAGVRYRIDDTWALSSNVRFQSYSNEIDTSENAISVKLNYISFGFGLLKEL